MKLSFIQRKLLTETLPPLEALNMALINEKGITNIFEPLTNLNETLIDENDEQCWIQRIFFKQSF